MRLHGKTAIVTGGASGFGEGIVRKFVMEGARVMVADLSGVQAQKLAEDLGCLAHRVDVSQADSVEEMAEAVRSQWDQVDILVNNAGITHLPKLMEEVTEEEFDRVFAVNAKSVYLTARSFVPMMKTAGTGAILNVASTAVSARAQSSIGTMPQKAG